MGNADPFTGSSSYTTQSTFFPLTVYRTFDMGDANVILEKLKEFNKRTGNLILDEELLESTVKSALEPKTSTEHIDVLFHLLSWPDEIVFPVIDVMRMAVKYQINNTEISLKNNGDIIKKILDYISPTCNIPNNTLVALRFLCNLFVHPTGEQLIYENRIDILENITSLKIGNKNAQIATATLLLNIVVLCLKRNDEIGVLILASVIPDRIVSFNDPEAQFRGYVGLGTLLSFGTDDHKKMVKEKIKENSPFIKKLQTDATVAPNDCEVKRKNCASLVQIELCR